MKLPRIPNLKTSPEYRAFARDLMKLCKKYGLRMTASDEGFVGIGPESLKTVGEYLYSEFEVTPTSAKLAGGWVGQEPKPIVIDGSGT